MSKTMLSGRCEKINLFSVTHPKDSIFIGGNMETKVCFRCKVEKELSKFQLHKSGINKGYHNSYCYSCLLEYKRKYFNNHPWLKHFNHAYTRCQPHRPYGKRGIKLLMTRNDFKALWFRDKACLLKFPSIDRIDTTGNYEIGNCRFIEMQENRMRKYKGDRLNDPTR